MGSVTKYNVQHLVSFGAWLKNKDVTAAEARDLCLKESPDDDPGLKNVEGWLVRFAEGWVPAGGQLLTQIDEEILARNMFNMVADTRDENRRLLKDLVLAQQLLEGKDKLLAEKVQLLEQADANIKELLAKATEKPDLGIRQLLDLAQPQAARVLDPDQF